MDKTELHKMSKDKIEQTFHLISPINSTNMVLYNADNIITKYKNTNDILKDFCDVRKQFYINRKNHIIKEIQKDISLLDIKIKFIYEFIENKIKIIKVKKQDIEKQLKDKQYPEVDNSYDYLLKMPIYNLSLEKIEDFESKLTKLNEDLDYIKSKSENELWCEDMDLIKQELTKYGYKAIKSKKQKLKIKT